MRLEEPHRYELVVQDGRRYTVKNSHGGSTFLAPVTQHGPKLYVFALKGEPVYIGKTVQPISNRIRGGFQADGTGGYHGYSLRNEPQVLELLVWEVEDATERDLECVESEIVFLCRQRYEQWPKSQTEIHFHQSTEEHRVLARRILDAFPAPRP